jgi:hypothetical protein
MSSDVSFTPGFSPVMDEDKTKNRFSGLLFSAKNKAVESQQVRSTSQLEKTVKTVP